jgi:hypothetical protein
LGATEGQGAMEGGKSNTSMELSPSAKYVASQKQIDKLVEAGYDYLLSGR